jgi:hypothetical protein
MIFGSFVCPYVHACWIFLLLLILVNLNVLPLKFSCMEFGISYWQAREYCYTVHVSYTLHKNQYIGYSLLFLKKMLVYEEAICSVSINCSCSCSWFYRRKCMITLIFLDELCFIVVVIDMVLDQQHQGSEWTCFCGAEGIQIPPCNFNIVQDLSVTYFGCLWTLRLLERYAYCTKFLVFPFCILGFIVYLLYLYIYTALQSCFFFKKKICMLQTHPMFDRLSACCGCSWFLDLLHPLDPLRSNRLS